MRRTTRLLAVAAGVAAALVVTATPAAAARRTPTTNYGGYCNLDGFAIPYTSLGLFKRVDYGGHANCFTGLLPRHILVQSHLYENNSHVASTSLAQCFDCFEVSVISSRQTLVTTPVRVDTDLTVHLRSGEVFLSPAPPNCTIYNGGGSIWCHLTDFA